MATVRGALVMECICPRVEPTRKGRSADDRRSRDAGTLRSVSHALEHHAGRRLALGAYASLLAAPFLGLAWVNRAYIARWWHTGACPGPMDRHGPCGVAELAFVVFFGGWTAVLVVPALVAWSLGCTAALAMVLRWRRRR